MTVTSGKSWREVREVGVELTLPSGNVAAVRPVEIDFFVLRGEMPDDLAAEVVKLINGQDGLISLPEVDQLAQAREKWLPFLNQLVTFAFVNPKVVSNPQADDEISVDDIAYNDKLFVYLFFARPAQKLRTFRAQQIRNVASVELEPNVTDASQPTTEDSGVGEPTDGDARRLDRLAV